MLNLAVVSLLVALSLVSCEVTYGTNYGSYSGYPADQTYRTVSAAAPVSSFSYGTSGQQVGGSQYYTLSGGNQVEQQQPYYTIIPSGVSALNDFTGISTHSAAPQSYYQAPAAPQQSYIYLRQQEAVQAQPQYAVVQSQPQQQHQYAVVQSQPQQQHQYAIVQSQPQQHHQYQPQQAHYAVVQAQPQQAQVAVIQAQPQPQVHAYVVPQKRAEVVPQVQPQQAVVVREEKPVEVYRAEPVPQPRPQPRPTPRPVQKVRHVVSVQERQPVQHQEEEHYQEYERAAGPFRFGNKNVQHHDTKYHN